MFSFLGWDNTNKLGWCSEENHPPEAVIYSVFPGVQKIHLHQAQYNELVHYVELPLYNKVFLMCFSNSKAYLMLFRHTKKSVFAISELSMPITEEFCTMKGSFEIHLVHGNFKQFSVAISCPQRLVFIFSWNYHGATMKLSLSNFINSKQFLATNTAAIFLCGKKNKKKRSEIWVEVSEVGSVGWFYFFQLKIR